MTNLLLRAGALSCALLATTCLTTPAVAQSTSTLPSVHKNVDGNGVDLTDGTFNFSMMEGSIGAGEGELALMRSFGRGGWHDNFPRYVQRWETGTQATIEVHIGNDRETFVGSLSATNFTSQQGSGATLTIDSTGYTYRTAQGVATLFGLPAAGAVSGSSNLCGGNTTSGCDLVPLSTTFPSGKSLPTPTICTSRAAISNASKCIIITA